MFFLQRQRKTVNDRSQNLEKLCNAIESLRLVNELEEDVIYRASNVGPQVQEFSVDPMKGGLEEVSFTRVFGVKQFKELLRQHFPFHCRQYVHT